MTYKYIIFGSSNDYDDVVYGQGKVEKMKYIPQGKEIENGLINVINRIHLSPKINNIFRIPFKNIWNSFYFNDQPNKGPYCFIFFPNRDYFRNIKYYDYLREEYPGSKFVLYCRDLIETYRNFDLEYYKKNFDLVLTYDQLEADKYKIKFVDSIYSKIDITNDGNESEKSDIFFIGTDKGRLNKIIELYEYFSERGLVCDFNITEVNEKNQKYPDKIKYNKKLSYIEVIERINRTNCILEIIQKNSRASTLRTMEAIFYNKKLLTNNKHITNRDFYDKNKMRIFDESCINEIDFNFITSSNLLQYENDIKKRYSLINLLNTIEKLLG